jgi:UDP-glucose 4-epimerase
VRVAITGALGFVGCRVARDLDARGHEVVLVDYADDSVHPLGRELLGGLELRRCDLTDAEAAERVLADAEAVFHAAALGTKSERELPRETLALNLTGTANALEGARRAGAVRFVLASSAVVYGEGGGVLSEGAVREDVTTIYAATKLAGEHLVRAYGHQFGLPGMSLRFMNVYGYQPEEFPFRELITKVLERIEAGQPPVIHGDGSSSFDFVHVDDVAHAVVLALEHPDATGEVNVGTGRGTSVREIAELLLRLSGSPLEPELRPDVAAPSKRYVADVAKARELIGFEAGIDLEQGIAAVIAERRERSGLPHAA